MIVGIGVDVVSISRFDDALKRRPALAERLFTTAERAQSDGSPRSAPSLAARFAAKEAVAKALGAPPGLAWHDCEITSGADGRPGLAVSGTVAERAASLGVRRWHLSLSHDAGIALAQVIAEGGGDAGGA